MPSGSSSIIIGAGIEPIFPLQADMPVEVANPTVPVSVRLAGDPALTSAIEIGPQANASANGAIALGGFVAGTTGGPRAVAANSIAIGAGGASPDNSPFVGGADGIALGRGSRAGVLVGDVGNVAVGRQAIAEGGAGKHIAIGESASAAGPNGSGIAIGFDAQVGGNGRSISIGRIALTGFDTDNIAIGNNANAQGTRALCLGNGANVGVGNLEGVAIGDGATVAAAASRGIAIGNGANADVADRTHIAGIEFYFGTGATRNRILRPRITGWTQATGTATRSGFDTATVTLAVLAEHVKALLDDLGLAGTGHGLIGA